MRHSVEVESFLIHGGKFVILLHEHLSSSFIFLEAVLGKKPGLLIDEKSLLVVWVGDEYHDKVIEVCKVM